MFEPVVPLSQPLPSKISISRVPTFVDLTSTLGVTRLGQWCLTVEGRSIVHYCKQHGERANELLPLADMYELFGHSAAQRFTSSQRDMLLLVFGDNIRRFDKAGLYHHAGILRAEVRTLHALGNKIITSKL